MSDARAKIRRGIERHFGNVMYKLLFAFLDSIFINLLSFSNINRSFLYIIRMKLAKNKWAF